MEGWKGWQGWGTSICAWKLYILQGHVSEIFGNNAPVYHGGRTDGEAQSVRENYTFSRWDICEYFAKNASVYHVYPVSRTTGE